MNTIRNFAIIAHVDHGKSTLADRLLEYTGTVSPRHMRSQLLDSNPIERERGITIKLAPVRMVYTSPLPSPEFRRGGSTAVAGEVVREEYVLNLIDTPGHVDFSYEVSRSLAACEGALLVVDATQGIQAQTLAHYHQARKLGLTIIPVINKIDITTADIENTKKQLTDILDFAPDSILEVSAKTGAGLPGLFQAILDRIPAPTSMNNEPTNQLTRALVFNSNFDPHLGVIAWIRVVDGTLTAHDRLHLLATNAQTSALEVGVFTPAKKAVNQLSAGEVGYVVTNLKDLSLLTVGDTITTNHELSNQLTPLPGYHPIQPVVFIGLYPISGTDINRLRDALGKLKLQDSALTYTPEFSPALGNGFRIGLLGLLHADIVQERLEREFDLSLIASAPSVSYQILTTNNELRTMNKVSDFPDPSHITEIREPLINLAIFVPETYLGDTMQLCQNHRATFLDMRYLQKLVHLTYTMPFSELLQGFYDSLKSVSAGFASLDYELLGFQAADLVKLDIMVASERIDALSQIVPRDQAIHLAKDLVEKLVQIIPRQQFEVPIQATIGAKVLARADIKAFRKDVIAKLSGGDQTRKTKLLEKQKKGKARMKRVGKIDIPQEAFLSLLSRR